MDDLGHMLMASFSNIWHLIPIVIGIILFKKFLNVKNKKNLIRKNEENEKNGLTLVLRTIKKYEDLGYKIINNQENNDEVSLICKKDDKTILIKCKDTNEMKSITDKDIKTFYRNAHEYLKENDIQEDNVEFRYAIPYSDILHKSAIKILSNDSYNCKYVIL